MNISKDYSKITLFFLFLYFLLLNIYQLYHQHWTAIIDQDVVIIYNSLLISSGFEQEYRDHPAYTTFLILGSIYKFFSIFFDNFTIQEIINSQNIDKSFQRLFIIARVLNSIYFFLVALILFNILKELNVKRNICISSIILIIFFQATYDLLFLLRSEIISVLMFLLFIFFLIKFIKNINKIGYCFVSGFFFCLAMLAKIQIIFLFITFLISLPFLFNCFKTSNSKNSTFYERKYYLLSSFFLIALFAGYVISQFVLGKFMLKYAYDPRFYFLYNVDLFLLSVFVIFYFIYIKFLSFKKNINLSEIFITISTIFLGFVFCIFFVFLLDFVNLIPFSKLTLMRLADPIAYMTLYTHKIISDSNIFSTMKDYFFGSFGFYPVSFNTGVQTPQIWFLDTRLFFRAVNLFIFLILIYLYAKRINNHNHTYLSISLYLGMIICFFSFNFRETHGYNIYLFPLYIILASIILDKFENKFVVIFYFILLISFLSENFVLSGLHKNNFIREPRIYSLCNIEKWKNSENYLKNYNKSAYIPLYSSENGKNYFKSVFKFDNRFLEKYCDEMKN